MFDNTMVDLSIVIRKSDMAIDVFRNIDYRFNESSISGDIQITPSPTT